MKTTGKIASKLRQMRNEALMDQSYLHVEAMARSDPDFLPQYIARVRAQLERTRHPVKRRFLRESLEHAEKLQS